MLPQSVLNTLDTVTFSVANVEIVRESEPRGIVRPAIGYHYQVEDLDRPSSRGFVDLTFQAASEMAESGETRSYLERNRISPDAIVADLVNFYPHGRRTDGKEEVLFRKGVGGAVFDIVLEDCKSAGAGILLAYTTTFEMRCFLTKRGFTPVQKNSTLYTLSLEDFDFTGGQLVGANGESARDKD